jgi:membrane protein
MPDLPPREAESGLAGVPSSAANWKRLALATIGGWRKHDLPTLSAALAYYTVLSLAPLLILAVAIGGLLFGAQAARGQIVWEMRDLVGRQGAEAVQSMLQQARQPAAGIFATIVGLITLLIGASGVFAQLRDSLNLIWDAPAQTSGGIWVAIKYRFFSFAMVFGIGFLLLVSLVISAALSAIEKYWAHLLPATPALLQGFNFLLSLAVETTLFALIYKIVPDVRIAWRSVWLGAAVTGLLFTAGKLLIGLYLGKASVGSAYGAAGSLVILLVWVYYSSQIFFTGAVLTHAMAEQQHATPAERAPNARYRQAG